MVKELRASPGGRVTRYLEAGAGWPVVLIHAFPLHADMWRPQLEQVPEGWRFIAPDLRGFGPAAAAAIGNERFTLDDMAADVGLLLDHLEIDRAVIGGLSMGGYVTFALFRKAPERFTGIVLADTKAKADTAEGRDGRRAMIEAARGGGAAVVADRMLPKLLGARTRRTRPGLARDVRAMIEATRVEPIVWALEAMMARPDSTPDLLRVPCPGLVIVGAEDELTPPAEAEAMQARLARSRLVVLPEAGHLSNLEAPEAFTRALSDFLASNL